VCKHLFVIEVLDDDDDVNSPDQAPTISLHALTGIQPLATRTMQLPIEINGIRLVDLLNSGSTHNFVDTNAAACVGIELRGHSGLRVTATWRLGSACRHGEQRPTHEPGELHRPTHPD
jgi:hypothetical protein